MPRYARILLAAPLMLVCNGACAQGLGFEMTPQTLPRVIHVQQPTAEQEAQEARQAEIERDMRLLRRRFFGSRNTEVRQIGIAQLRQYNDPEHYPSLLKVFARDRMDVREAIMDMLAAQRTNEADATLAWSAVFGADDEMQEIAYERLADRVGETGEVSDRVKLVLIEGLERESDGPPEAAAEIARKLRIADLIPYLIVAQAGPPRSESDRTGNLANIVIGRQIAFVSDLQPVVSDSAVGFDPELSVVVEGVVLGISDAVVTTYRPAVHRSLLGLSSDLWGQPTTQFAYDNAKWQRWYRTEFRPYWLERQAEG